MPFLITLVAIGLAVVLWAVVIERNWFAIRKVDLAILPAGSPEITVLHISDIHLHPAQSRKIRWLKNLEKLNPDLIINTGDNMGHSKALPELEKALAPLMKTPGVFVFGGNDYKAPVFKNPMGYLIAPSKTKIARKLDIEKLTAVFDRSWNNLNNNSVNLEIKGLKISFLGLNDAHEQLDDVSMMKKTMDTSESEVVIGVSHAPYHRILQSFGLHGANLVFAGHTHGGQVCLPGSKAIVTNCDLPTENAKGISNWVFDGSDLALHVSAGVGTSIYAPFRLFCRPEVSLVTLKPKTL